ncbi:MAG: phosphoenolpyruvate synthase, partial [Desulfovibrionaceae bacterium]|nr:phosphoenolpyruvate synthase [Desulfovibrionaceae bacterium]
MPKTAEKNTQANAPAEQEKIHNSQNQKLDPQELMKKLVLNGAEIAAIGVEAELLVGGKNYNTAIIDQVPGVKIPQFRAISATAFHKVLDENKVNASLIRRVVDREYGKIDWNDPEINRDPEFLQKFVRALAKSIREEVHADKSEAATRLRSFVNHVVEGFATSPEGIDQLRQRSVLVQAAILSVDLPKEVRDEVMEAYRAICREAGEENAPVAVRSSAAGEDSRKKAFAGLQDTYLNIVGEEDVALAYHWDCASAYNLRSMTYRREAILDATARAEELGDDSIAEQAKHEWAIENTSLSVCIMRMINPLMSGTAFSADTATGCRGTKRNELVSIDVSYGLGEAIVGGMVTPDKYYVFQRDDGKEVVIRQMGVKDKKIIYDSKGGTKVVPVQESEIYRWAIPVGQAERIARGVRAISKTYGSIIMDTEFCIDKDGELWFVQARPETRWNEELEEYPDVIFMRRKEVDPIYASTAEVVLRGNGASRGAGQGTVRFLRSALELNKIRKGDILAAERTDPDMVPGMRVASAILADVGGDTSHAAITSRELGIPAVIGIQNLSVIQGLDGSEVTVDGTTGSVYRGLLPLYEVGGEMDLTKLPPTKTRVGLVLADVNQAMFLSRLRRIPDFEVGLLRAEFMLGNVGVHPQALEAYDKGELDARVEEALDLLEQKLSKILRNQLAAGLIHTDMKVREYVGAITGLADEIRELGSRSNLRGTDEVLALHRQMRELENRLDEYEDNAAKHIDILKTSPFLREHIIAIMGFGEELSSLVGADPEVKRRRKEIMAEVENIYRRAVEMPVVKEELDAIEALREEVALRTGLAKDMHNVRSIPERIREVLRTCGAQSGRDHYVQTLAQGLALFAMAFYGREIIYRTTDFKSNEYRNLIGGSLFEAEEDNPMLGYRGVARNIHDWEIEAFKLARNVYGGSNLQLMLPFVRTLEQARTMRRYLEQVHHLKSGEDGLKIILMSEIPANAILAKEFIQEFDGFSIGSNDMTQMVLATDRDNASLAHIYDEIDPAVVWAILVTIFTGQRYGKKVGFCGQGVSNNRILRGVVSIAGIAAASVVPDTYYQTKLDIAQVEAENIPTCELGQWISSQLLSRLGELLESRGYGHIHRKYKNAAEIMDWYEGEMARFSEQLRESLDTPKEDFYRQELEQFRSTFHKPVI